VPELLRINGAIMLRFLQSLDWPRRQEVLALGIADCRQTNGLKIRGRVKGGKEVAKGHSGYSLPVTAFAISPSKPERLLTATLAAVARSFFLASIPPA
jgi:hypothetical protein